MAEPPEAAKHLISDLKRATNRARKEEIRQEMRERYRHVTRPREHLAPAMQRTYNEERRLLETALRS